MTDRQPWTDQELRDLFRLCQKESDNIWDYFHYRSIDSILFAIHRFARLNNNSNRLIKNNIQISPRWKQIWTEEQSKNNKQNIFTIKLLLQLIFSFIIIMNLYYLYYYCYYHSSYHSSYHYYLMKNDPPKNFINIFDNNNWL